MELCLSYGGSECCIHSDAAAVPIRRPEAPFDRFMVEEGLDSSVPIDIQIQRGPIPFPDGMKQICDNPGSWKMFSDNKQRTIYHHPPAFPDPLWRLNHTLGCSQFELQCSEQFLLPESNGSILNPFTYPIDILSLMYHFGACESGFILHGGAAFTDSGAILFSGESTAGKTTLARLCLEAGLKVLSDDRIILRTDGSDAVQAWGTPWLGDPDIAINESAPVRALCFLTQGSPSRLVPMSTAAAVRRLLQVSSIPWFDDEMTRVLLSVCERFLKRIPVYELVFRPDSTAVDALLSAS
jgi:hypothetical protein